MINFDKHLKEVLYEYDFIVIPNFGAFIANFEVIEKNGESFPAKTFSFNRLLNVDENQKFFNFLVRVENKPFSEIEIQWNNYLLNLKNELNKNKRFEVEGLGSVISNPEKETTFKFLDDINFYERDKFSQENEFESLSVLPSSPTIVEEISPETEIVEDIPEISPAIHEAAKSVETVDFKEDLRNEVEEYSEVEEEYYEEESPNRWKFLIWLLPLLLLLAAAYYFFNNRNLEEKSVQPLMDTSSVAIDSTIVADSSLTDSSTFEEPIVSAEVEKVVDLKPTPKAPKIRFHVWAGLFRSKSNAEKLRKKLRNGGLKGEIQMVKDMRRVYVPVSTEAEAKTTVKKIEQLTGEKAVYFEVD
ncbi:Sporulation related domain-containing protein [Spirosomataceae bacterium TFI 002]|nr:Sporulation related domain-containing protein [Spirosomataceae bacterium TFI 002]